MQVKEFKKQHFLNRVCAVACTVAICSLILAIHKGWN